ncbi:helix-hairpin-helix domain-containing protein [Geodermatophilus sp. YIM 151500]|uniref:ComEA family DNA-binding protein n=1 Tax=Geodermatophilus sp. YIM 151500 TaxID=2984531 RepID=UPI0021E4D290|nr:helix-hairpin-helix domain-containing protein [Geodermatophilus sp. YIM 151500]MCV2491628.1 helix-hairpin-helix domain-containing protein [Geodermatophilus sp. YIM 151500]
MRLSARRPDDADVIRARLRALLQEAERPSGWVPDDLEGDRCPVEPPAAPDRSPEGPDGPTDDECALPAGLGRHRTPGTAARWDTGRPGARALWSAGLLAVVLLLGWTWLDRPRVEPVPAGPAGAAGPGAEATAGSAAGSVGAPPATPSVGTAAEATAPVVVSVVGLVVRPGLVTLPAGARVADAVAAAGGLLPEADPASVNLAAPLSDGQQVAVGAPGAPAAPPAAAGAATPDGPVTVNLNTATEAELDALPGIGPVLAGRIVDHRTRHGPFRSVDQLDDVPGIGPAVFEGVAGAVTV